MLVNAAGKIIRYPSVQGAIHPAGCDVDMERHVSSILHVLAIMKGGRDKYNQSSGWDDPVR